jgi:threonine dehydrogenase-like Zn-dependent dehydrogenase
MRAVIIESGSCRAAANEPRPTPGNGEVLVQPSKVLLDALDAQIVSGAMAHAGIIGRHMIGTVTHLGAQVDGHWKGKPVLCQTVVPCAECDLCQRGLREHCRNRLTPGIRSHAGCLADTVCRSVRGLIELDAGADADQMIFADIVAAVMQTQRQLTIENRPYITILGDDPSALLHGQMMSKLNASVRVIGWDRQRLELCERWQVRHRHADDIGRRGDQDVVVDCTLRGDGLDLALQLVRPQGIVVCKSPVSFTGQGADRSRMVLNEVRLVGSFAGPVRSAQEALMRREVDVLSLIAGREAFGNIERALQRLRQGTTGLLIEMD